MTRTVVLRGGPLDGHLRQVHDGVRTAYFPHTTGNAEALARLGNHPGNIGMMLVLVYKQVAEGMPIWKYVGANQAAGGQEGP